MDKEIYGKNTPMSTFAKHKNCQKEITKLQQTMDTFCLEVVAAVEAGPDQPVALRLSFEEQLLFAATFSHPHLPTALLAADETSSMAATISHLNTLFGRGKAWEAITDTLSEQENAGAVHTALSRAMHHILHTPSACNLVVACDVLEDSLPNPAAYQNMCLSLTKGERYEQTHLISRLIQHGFVRHARTHDPGSIIVRGDTVDITH
ncbi:MAG: hypothetical protein ACRD4B_03355, partial [Acidobacteriota bacterium]